MFKLHIGQKTGFSILRPEREVIIRDESGRLFYSTESKTPDVKQFNLPGGQYLVDSGVFRSMPNPIDYPLMRLPPKERNRPIPNPNTVPMKWGVNPNKCSIVWRCDNMGNVIENAPARHILADYALKEWTKPEQDFIRFHEYSHADYETEKFADFKAANYMILKGYNPIQIGMSQIDSLSGRQAGRKNFLVDMLIKHYGKYL